MTPYSLEITGGVVSMKNQIAAPTVAMKHPKYKADDHPPNEAMNGVRTGAMKPPTLFPVFSTPHAAPTFSPPASMVAAQKGPSEAEAKPKESASKAPTIQELDA